MKKIAFMRIVKSQKVISYIGILLTALLVGCFLCNEGLQIQRDDGVQHLIRIIETSHSIEDNPQMPLIMSQLCNHFGYSWNLFYSPLTAFLPLVLKIVLPTFESCFRLFLFLALLLSGIFMNQFVYEVTKNRKISTLSAIFYMLAPYHLTDLYTRVAIAELTSFVFLPMIFLGLYSILEQEGNKDYWLAIGSIGILLTHTILTFYTAFLAFVYLLFHIKKLKNREVLKRLRN